MNEILGRSLGGNIQIEMKLSADLWPVEIDVGEFELAMLNVCVNSRDAMAGGGTITIPNNPAQIKKEFEYAKNAGFPLIFVDPEPAALDTIEQMAKTYDIKVAIHNQGPEDKRWPRPQDAYAAVKSRDKRLGLCIDVGHTLRTGTDPVQACRESRDRLYDRHVQDLAAKSDKESQVAVGRGVIDFPALFKTRVDIRYQGQVGLEYEINAKNPLPGMIESMAYMRGVLAAVATSKSRLRRRPS